jgi:hypothetical protein
MEYQRRSKKVALYACRSCLHAPASARAPSLARTARHRRALAEHAVNHAEALDAQSGG